MPLTDISIRNAQAAEKAYKLADANGMYLLVKPNGGKYWRFKYYYAKKEKLLSIGTYPEVSLKEARERCDQARTLLRDGIDPMQAKQEEKRQTVIQATNTFESVAREWYANQQLDWTARYAGYVLRRLETDLFPALGNRPVAEISAPELLAVLRKIEERDALEVAQRALQKSGEIFRYAIATGKAERDVAADLRGALKTRKKKNHVHLEEKELPEFFSRLARYEEPPYNGEKQTRLALELLILTFVRTTELRGARWEEIDFEKAEWRIPAERMKMKTLHIVPLSRQALAILRSLKELNGHREYVFPNSRKPRTFISENTLLYALYYMGYRNKATSHGFRSTASTILHENGWASEMIERQLAHIDRNKVRASYNHAQYLSERHKMMQWWADHLDSLRIS